MTGFLHHNLTEPLPETCRGAVIAIGNFDGVHLGHQVVLKHAMEKACDMGVPCYALSFEPHPRTLFRPQSPVFRLTLEPMKARILQAFGLDGMLILPFTRDLAATSADEFVDEFLINRAGICHVVTGFNFHFGKDRAGSPQFLQKAGEKRGFGVTIVDAVSSEEEVEPVSSSSVRELLVTGDVSNAAQLLGYRWQTSGEVIKGAQLGRTLNYPTANLSLPASCDLAHGIYAVRLRRANGILYNGVASYGRRPTFDNGEALLETFIFDFSDDLYGEEIQVSLFDYLRGEEKFDSADALVDQMNRDSVLARVHLANCKPLTDLDNKLNFDGLV